MREIYKVEITNEEIIFTLESTIPGTVKNILFSAASSEKKIYKINQIVGAKVSKAEELILMEKDSSDEIILVEDPILTAKEINDRVKAIWGRIRLFTKNYIVQIKTFKYFITNLSNNNVNNNSNSAFLSYLESKGVITSHTNKNANTGSTKSIENFESDDKHTSKKRKMDFKGNQKEEEYSEKEEDLNEIEKPRDEHIEPIFKRIKENYDSINNKHAVKFKKDYYNNPKNFLPSFRYKNIMTRIQPGFEHYPGAEIPIFSKNKKECFNLLLEGPTEDFLEEFFSILFNKNINTIVAIGKSKDETGNEKFYDYIEKSEEITPLEFLRATKTTNHTSYPTTLNDTTFKFHKYLIPEKTVFHIMHIPTWEDHALPQFTLNDLQFLACFFMTKPNAAYHCSAGVERSVMLIITEMVFKQKIFMQNEEIFLQEFYRIIEEIKAVKPCAGNVYQLLAVPGLAEDLYENAVALKFIQPNQESSNDNSIGFP